MLKNYLITSLTSCENLKLIKARVSNPDLALLFIPLCARPSYSKINFHPHPQWPQSLFALTNVEVYIFIKPRPNTGQRSECVIFPPPCVLTGMSGVAEVEWSVLCA